MAFRLGSYYRSTRGHLWRLVFITDLDECVFFIPEIQQATRPIPMFLCQAFLDEVEAEAS